MHVDMASLFPTTSSISNWHHLRRLIKKPIGLVMGLNNLADIFKQEYYSNLEGGILEAFGVLFKDNIRIYAYPVEQETFERYRATISQRRQCQHKGFVRWINQCGKSSRG